MSSQLKASTSFAAVRIFPNSVIVRLSKSMPVTCSNIWDINANYLTVLLRFIEC